MKITNRLKSNFRNKKSILLSKLIYIQFHSMILTQIELFLLCDSIIKKKTPLSLNLDPKFKEIYSVVNHTKIILLFFISIFSLIGLNIFNFLISILWNIISFLFQIKTKNEKTFFFCFSCHFHFILRMVYLENLCSFSKIPFFCI